MTTTKTKKQATLQEGTVILSMTIHCPPMVIRSRKSKIDTNGNQTWYSIIKKLIECPEYTRLNGIRLKANDWVRQKSVPNRVLKSGMHLVAVPTPDMFEEYLSNMEKEFAEAADAFCKVIEDAKEKAKKELKDGYDPDNYMSGEALRRQCWVERELLDFTVPQADKIGAAFAKAERNKAKAKWNTAAEDVKWMLRLQFQELIAGLSQALTPAEDGKKRKLTDKVYDDLVEWMELFTKRNILNDSELEKLVTTATNALQGKSAQAMRDDASLRDEIGTKVVAVAAKVQKCTEGAPERLFDFDE